MVRNPWMADGIWRRRAALPVIVAVGFALHAVAAADTACPTNQVSINSSPTASTDPSFNLSGRAAAGSYDLRQGGLASSSTFSDLISGSAIDTDDVYWLVGLPSGVAIDFTAQFAFGGSWNVYPGSPQGDRAIFATLASDDASASWPSPFGGFCCHANVSQTLSIPLHETKDQGFHLRLHLESQEYRGNVTLNGTLSFPDLPPGVGVVSCQGYVSSAPLSVAGGGFSPLRLSAPRPNPAQAAIAATVSLPVASAARLEVLDVQGRVRVQRDLAFASAGAHEVRIDAGRALESGTYFLRLTQSGRAAIRSFTVVR